MAVVQKSPGLEGATGRVAEWRPGWYELDHPIQVGRAQQFAFFPPNGGVLVFYNTLWKPDEAVAARGVVGAIEHEYLGSVANADTEGLDYTFTLADGRELVVNAEEEPGTIYERANGEWRVATHQVSDWTLRVEFTELDDLEPAPPRLERIQEPAPRRIDR